MDTTQKAGVTLPTYYLSHGGGPWPWMMAGSGGRFDRLDASLKDLRASLGDVPEAVLMVSAHWEEPVFTFSAHPNPPMLYDYYGFPAPMYEIEYPAPGNPALAERAAGLLTQGGMPARLDHQRGFDHGTFSLMQALWPEADMPVVQMSIRADFDPAAHLEAGRLLAPLRGESVLILGSGLSFHNLRALGHPAAQEPSQMFDRWLQQSLVDLSGPERAARLLQWEQAPAARIAQPREDHLLPLMVATGAAGTEAGGTCYHEDSFMGVAATSFRFGELPALSQ